MGNGVLFTRKLCYNSKLLLLVRIQDLRNHFCYFVVILKSCPFNQLANNPPSPFDRICVIFDINISTRSRYQRAQKLAESMSKFLVCNLKMLQYLSNTALMIENQIITFMSDLRRLVHFKCYNIPRKLFLGL